MSCRDRTSIRSMHSSWRGTTTTAMDSSIRRSTCCSRVRSRATPTATRTPTPKRSRANLTRATPPRYRPRRSLSATLAARGENGNLRLLLCLHEPDGQAGETFLRIGVLAGGEVITFPLERFLSYAETATVTASGQSTVSTIDIPVAPLFVQAHGQVTFFLAAGNVPTMAIGSASKIDIGYEAGELILHQPINVTQSHQPSQGGGSIRQAHSDHARAADFGRRLGAGLGLLPAIGSGRGQRAEDAAPRRRSGLHRGLGFVLLASVLAHGWRRVRDDRSVRASRKLIDSALRFSSPVGEFAPDHGRQSIGELGYHLRCSGTSSPCACATLVVLSKRDMSCFEIFLPVPEPRSDPRDLRTLE